MAVLRRRDTIREYILEAEKDLQEDQQTVWLYRRPSFVFHREIEQTALRANGDNANSHQAHIALRDKILTECIVGWKNFKDEEGHDVLFPIDPKTGRPTQKLVEIVLDFAEELIGKIMEVPTKKAPELDR
jgi:hypothetical protein